MALAQTEGGKRGAFVAGIRASVASVLDEARGGRLIDVTRSGSANRTGELGRVVGLVLLDRGGFRQYRAHQPRAMKV